MHAPDRPLHYCAYLLRCWAEHSTEHPVVWRFSVEDPRTGERQGFATLELLLAFLRSELGDAPLDTASEQD